MATLLGRDLDRGKRDRIGAGTRYLRRRARSRHRFEPGHRGLLLFAAGSWPARSSATPPGMGPAVRAALGELQRLYAVEEAFLIDGEGMLLAASGGPAAGNWRGRRRLVNLVLAQGPSVYPAVRRGDSGRSPAYSLAVPVHCGGSGRGIAGVRIGTDRLNRLLGSWSGGPALLVSPQGIVFAASREAGTEGPGRAGPRPRGG